MLLKLKNYFLALLSLCFILVGCTGGSDDPLIPESDPNDNKLRSLSFLQSNNTGLTENCAGNFNDQIVYITVPEGVSLNKLVPSFNVAQDATVTIDGNTVISNTVSLDFSKTVKLVVTSKSGMKRTYTVLVKNGITRIDNMVYAFMTKHSVPGVSIAVSRDEEIVYRGAYGFAETTKEERVTEKHMFRLASMSKQHTAIAIMKLYEEGKLKLEDYVFGKNGILGDMLGDDIGDARARYITVRHLLEHTSGYSVDCIFGGLSRYSGKSLKERMVYQLKNETLATDPGTTHKYNNFGFSALGLIVEEISGKDFETYLKEEIYSKSPVAITGIRGGKNDRQERFNNEVEYYAQGGKDAYGNNVEVGIAAGGIIATAEDLMRLMSMVDYGTKVPDVLEKETLDVMYTASAVRNRYALGWRVNYSSIPTWAAYHGGTLAGVCPIWARSINNVNGVILCNSRSYDMDIDDDMWYMLEDIQAMF